MTTILSRSDSPWRWRPELSTASQALDTFEFTFKRDNCAVYSLVTCTCTLSMKLVHGSRQNESTRKPAGLPLFKFRSSLIIVTTSLHIHSQSPTSWYCRQSSGDYSEAILECNASSSTSTIDPSYVSAMLTFRYSFN